VAILFNYRSPISNLLLTRLPQNPSLRSGILRNDNDVIRRTPLSSVLPMTIYFVTIQCGLLQYAE